MAIQITFFDYLAIADRERIHTQMLAWLFSDYCEALSQSQKRQLYRKLVNKPDDLPPDTKFSTQTEYQSIDLIIIAGNDCCVIENKLKSTQHSNQLERYQKEIQEDARFKGKNTVYCFLTLVGEEVQSLVWQSIEYENFFNALREVMSNNAASQENQKHTIILQEYIATLGNLIQAKNQYFNPEFRESFYTTSHSEEVSQYIRNNKLEMILEIAFWSHITTLLGEQSIIDKFIAETHKNSLLDIRLCQFSLPSQNGETNKFYGGIQFQSNTAKINIAAVEYNKSEPNWLPKEVVCWFENNKDSNYKRVNKPKPKGKSFLSMSKKLPLNQQILSLTEEEIVNILSDEINIAKEKLNKFFIDYLKVNSPFDTESGLRMLAD